LICKIFGLLVVLVKASSKGLVSVSYARPFPNHSSSYLLHGSNVKKFVVLENLDTLSSHIEVQAEPFLAFLKFGQASKHIFNRVDAGFSSVAVTTVVSKTSS
jgi:hypothetical protein